jgi:NAD(P)-dependent dehydrogenase (short-subunit alcohol dehydrogenase family)
MSDGFWQAVRASLEEAARRKGWRVVVERLEDEEVQVGAGGCELRGERRIYLDARGGDRAAAQALAEALAEEGADDVYLSPAARDLVEHARRRSPGIGRVIALALSAGMAAWTASAAAEAPDAAEILKRSMERHAFGFEEARFVFTMEMKKKGGDRRIRRVASRAKKKDGLLRQHLCFLGPAEVKNAAFLSVERRGGADDQYLWLPGQGRLRRITASQRSGSFMGSDFAYRDLEKRDVADGVHRVTAVETLGGHECWVVESVPRPGSDEIYGKILTWVRKSDDFPLRTKFFDRDGRHVKTLFVREIGRAGDKLYAKRLRMWNLEKGSSTYLTVEEIEPRAQLPDEIFTAAYLARGRECVP